MKAPINKPYSKMTRQEKRKYIRWCKKNKVVDGAVLRHELKKDIGKPGMKEYLESLPDHIKEMLITVNDPTSNTDLRKEL